MSGRRGTHSATHGRGSSVAASLDQADRLRINEYLPSRSCPIARHQFVLNHVGLHWHEFYEVFLVISGHGVQQLNGREAALGPGTLVLLTPADFHQLEPDAGGSLELINIGFATESADKDVMDLLLGMVGPWQMVESGHRLQTLTSEFRRLLNEQNAQHLGYRRVMQGSLDRILIELARRCYSSDSTHLDWTRRSNLQRAIAYIHHHFREPLSLADLAEQAQLSAHYFSERFHRATGIPFNAYVRDLRLRFAHGLLEIGEVNITEVCFASGFSSLSAFERAFRRAYGQAPTTYARTRRAQSAR